MHYSAELLDEKRNPVFTTLFESYLSKFILENPHLYQRPYNTLLAQLDNLLKRKIAENNEPGKTNPLDRALYSIFSNVSFNYPGYESFDAFASSFNLTAADFLIKAIADTIITPKQWCESPTSPTKFFDEVGASRRSPFNPGRNPRLFSKENRGVTEIIRVIARRTKSTSPIEDIQETCDLGIVSPRFRPIPFTHFFSTPIEPAGLLYTPLESSYVAHWLREHMCPVISGAAGTTELMYARIFPVTSLSVDEQEIIIFAQACNMIANGHHSFFESMLVADDFEHKLSPKPTVRALYLQCVPESIQRSDEFQAFMSSPEIMALPLDTPLTSQISAPIHSERALFTVCT